MKIITMYLPQYHRTTENDKWWGEGFTDWIAVRKARPLFKNHQQPKKPLNGNYYDLLQKEPMVWQSMLMKKYGIDGQCFYHYWFKDGRKILEKPAENWLKWKELDMPICFCWANESWARTWSNISGKNAWAGIFENDRKDDTAVADTGVLLEQKYGDEMEWREHFEYLLPFFKDSRYIKINGKPLFMIYKPMQIPCLEEMLGKWNKWAEFSGLSGMFFIGANCSEQKKQIFDKVLMHQPVQSLSALDIRNLARDGVMHYEYQAVWNEIIEHENYDEKTIYGGFCGYDDTPRHGIAGAVVDNQNPKVFGDNLAKLIAKNVCNNNNLIFINAWNEWGEGMYLEPDTKTEYQYLEKVIYAKENYMKYLDQFKKSEAHDSRLLKQLNDLQIKNSQNEEYWRIFDAWMGLKEREVKWDTFFKERNIKNVGIYGMGMFGNHLVKELEKSDIEIIYGIDRKGETIHSDFKIYRPEDNLPVADAVVVTVTYAFDEIKQKLGQKGIGTVISLAHIIEDLR